MTMMRNAPDAAFGAAGKTRRRLRRTAMTARTASAMPLRYRSVFWSRYHPGAQAFEMCRHLDSPGAFTGI